MDDKLPEIPEHIGMEDVPASVILPKRVVTNTEDLPDVIRINEPFWFMYNNGARYNAYKKGVTMGTYSEARCNTGTVFELFYDVFKVVLREVSEIEEHQIAEFDNHLKLLKNLFDLIEDSVDTTLKSDILGEELFAEMYGAFVGYIESNLKD